MGRFAPDRELTLLHKTLARLSSDFQDVLDTASAVKNVFTSSDGRWTLFSTSLTAGVAVSVAWLALSAAPPSMARVYEPRREQASLSYDLLVRLSGGKDALSAAGPAIDAALAAEQSGVQAAKPSIEIRTLTVDNGDTMMGMLTDAGVTAQDAAAVVNALQPVYSPRSIRPGQVFDASFKPTGASTADPLDNSSAASDARLVSLSFSPSVERQITVTLTPEGGYSAQDMQKKLEIKYQHAGATIDSSLYLAAMQSGIPASVVVELIRIFSYDVDFQRDVQPGDSFEVFYNHYVTEDGEPAKDGQILQATMTLSGQSKTLYGFNTADGFEYFDKNGQSAKSMLMKTPVDGARISSTFGMRFHPVLGYSRMHKGVDFAVPKGTPVMAAGSGTIAYAGWESGYGNFVLINHGNGYSTAYGHLSKINVKRGQRVRQGQIVALSGMTGLATGPHLHYEIRMNNSQVNPLKVKVASGRKLAGKELAAFEAERGKTEQQMATTPMQRQVASASGLRDTAQQ